MSDVKNLNQKLLERQYLLEEIELRKQLDKTRTLQIESLNCKLDSLVVEVNGNYKAIEKLKTSRAAWRGSTIGVSILFLIAILTL